MGRRLLRVVLISPDAVVVTATDDVVDPAGTGRTAEPDPAAEVDDEAWVDIDPETDDDDAVEEEWGGRREDGEVLETPYGGPRLDDDGSPALTCDETDVCSACSEVKEWWREGCEVYTCCCCCCCCCGWCSCP